MNIIETEAIILNTRDYGESDRLITFYTKAGGKLRGIAKGARRSRRRFVHAFEPCSLALMGYRERKSLIWVEACKLVEPHLGLRTDVERWGYAALMSEMVLEMTPEAEPQPEIFFLLKEALAQLSEDRDSLNVMLLFAIRLLDLLGYLPALEGCGVCQKSLQTATRWWWQIPRGRLLCAEHRSGGSEDLPLDLGTLVLIRQTRRLPLHKLWRLHILQERKVPLLHGLLGWVRDHIRKNLKSMRMLEQVQSA